MGQKLYNVRGRTLEEAYQKMRRKFGAEAVAISTHQVTQGGVFGLFGEKLVEITISVPGPRAPSAVERKYAEHQRAQGEPEMGQTLQTYEKLIRAAQRRMNTPPQHPAAPSPRRTPPPRSGAPAAAMGSAAPSPSPVLPFPKRKPEHEAGTEDLRREIQEIREMLQVMYAESPGAGLPTEFAPHYRTLVNRGVSRKVAAALIGAVLKNSDLGVIRDPRVFGERLHFEIRKALRVTGGIALHGGHCRVVALCGATGVGKTTNLAKLAAQFSVRQRANVALLTTDTYRVAAPEQLRVYANIIGVPLRVANDAKEAAEALRAFRDYDLVLIDTAGGSQFNLEQINELKGILYAVRPHETVLVLGANTQLADLQNTVSNFKCLGPTSVLFTKLDETRQYGAMFSILVEAGLPLSFASVGQNVPDDIRIASPGMIANLILEGRARRG